MPNTSIQPSALVQALPKDAVKFAFDIIKIDQIFDYLPKDKQIKLPKGHKIL